MTNLKFISSREKILCDIIEYIESGINRYIHILGGPGMGKTTFLKKIEDAVVNEPRFIVKYIDFKNEETLSLNRWLYKIINELNNDYNLEFGIVIENNDFSSSRSHFKELIRRCKNPKYVRSYKIVILLFDNFHEINDNHDYPEYYKYFSLLHEQRDCDNLGIVVTTIKNYKEGLHAASSFYSKCGYDPILSLFSKNEIKEIFEDLSDNLINEIERQTGGHPELIYKTEVILNKFESNEISIDQLNHVFYTLNNIIRLERYTNSLNNDEKELLTDIVKACDYSGYINEIDIQNSLKSSINFQKSLRSLRNVGIIRKTNGRLAINGSLFEKKIRSIYLINPEIYDIINNETKVSEEFLSLGVTNGNKIKEWLIDNKNNNQKALIFNVSDLRSDLIAMEIAALTNTKSGVIAFGMNEDGFVRSNFPDKNDIEVILDAINFDNNEKPAFLQAYFIIEGQRIFCLLVKKNKTDIYYNGHVYKKIGGYPYRYDDIHNGMVNPDVLTSKRDGYLFLPDIIRYTKGKKDTTRKNIYLQDSFLSNSDDIKIFFKWLKEIGGESEIVEFKTIVPVDAEEKQTLWSQMVGMANTSSGILIIGIKENEKDFRLVNIPDPDKEQRKLRNMLDHPKLHNVRGGKLLERSFKGDTFILYLIPKARHIASFQNRFYERVGRHKQEIKIDKIDDFIIHNFIRGPTGYIMFKEFENWKKRYLALLKK